MLEKILLDLGAPILSRIIGQKFGRDAQEIAQVGIEALAGVFGVEPSREAVEAAVRPTNQAVARKVAEAEASMPDLLLAQAEKMRAGNEQQRLTNELLLSAQADKPMWTWAWLYVWQYVLMGFWAWTLVLVHIANAALRLAGGGGDIPAPTVPDLLTLTTLYLGLHMGGHTVLEMVRNRWGRAGDAE